MIRCARVPAQFGAVVVTLSCLIGFSIWIALVVVVADPDCVCVCVCVLFFFRHGAGTGIWMPGMRQTLHCTAPYCAAGETWAEGVPTKVTVVTDARVILLHEVGVICARPWKNHGKIVIVFSFFVIFAHSCNRDENVETVVVFAKRSIYFRFHKERLPRRQDAACRMTFRPSRSDDLSSI